MQHFSVPVYISTSITLSQVGQTRMVLREAVVNVLQVMGPSGRDVVISEVKSRCNYEQEYLESSAVVAALECLFGPAAAGLLIYRIWLVENDIRRKQSSAIMTAKS